VTRPRRFAVGLVVGATEQHVRRLGSDCERREHCLEHSRRSYFFARGRRCSRICPVVVVREVWATRIADAERARFSKELESYKSDLQHLSEERRDALTRKRDVYAQVATSMRVFLAAGRLASDDEKREFLVAFDQATLWGSEDVVKSLAHFLEQSTRNTAQPGSVSNDEFKNAYRECMIAMRRDCGFPDTTFRYPVVTFR
jgi:hypothetical protein